MDVTRWLYRGTVISLLFVSFLLAPTAHAIDCGEFTEDTPLQPNFASAWPLFTPAYQTSLISGTCFGKQIMLRIGNQSKTVVYKHIYQWNGEKWEQGRLTGPSFGTSQNWIQNTATGNATFGDNEETYVAAYVCERDGSVWRCGCRSKQSCSPSGGMFYWNMQKFVKPEGAGNSYTSNNDDTDDDESEEGTAGGTSGTAGESGFVPNGYTLKWNDEFETLSLGNTSQFRWTPYDTLAEKAGYAAKGRILTNNSSDSMWVADYEVGSQGGRTRGEAMKSSGQFGSGPYFHEVSDGTIKLRAFKLPGSIQNEFVAYQYPAGAPYAAGGLFGALSHARTYGYYEIRLKINSVTKGQHFALWLLQDDLAWPPEIDILEVIGNDPLYHLTAHGEGPGGSDPSTEIRLVPEGGLGSWHTLGFWWTPETMRYFIDGREYILKDEWGQGKEVGTLRNYVNKPMYMLMTWEIASYWPGDPDSTKWPAEVEVDYVRIYGD